MNEKIKVIDEKGNEYKGVFEQSPDTKALIDFCMKKVLENDGKEFVVQYEEFSNEIGRNVRTVARHYLSSALNYIWSNHHVSTDCVRGIGIKFLVHDGSVNVLRGKKERISKASKRALKFSRHIQIEKLSKPKKIEALAEISTIGVMVMISSRKYENKILEETKRRDSSIPTAKLLEIFTDKK